MHCIRQIFYVCIAIHYTSLLADIQDLYYKTLAVHDRGLFDQACTTFKAMYNAGLRDHTVTSKLMLHALRTQNWHEAPLYNVESYWWYDRDISGHTIALTHDGGFGDAIMFMRYAKHLYTAGGRVIVHTLPALIPLFSRCPFIEKCVTMGIPMHADDHFRVSTPDLTLTMHNTLQEPSKDIPYIFADENLEQYWQTILAGDTRTRIGLCWSTSYLYNRSTDEVIPGPRCIPLEIFGSLCTTDSCTFYSLVKGYGEKDILAYPHLPIITYKEFDTRNGNFMDTAALMKNLDLVITADTCIAHLAGALGIPVWVVLPANSDFRWFVDRADSPWYPTMRLFRQRTFGEWEPIIQEVHAALKLFAQQAHHYSAH